MSAEILLSFFQVRIFKIIAVLALMGAAVAWYSLNDIRSGAQLERNIRMLKDLSAVAPDQLADPGLQIVYGRLATALKEETEKKPVAFSGLFRQAQRKSGWKEYAGKFLAGAAFFLLLYFLQSIVRLINIVKKRTYKWWFFFRKNDFYSLLLCVLPGLANAMTPMFVYPAVNYLLLPSVFTLLTLLVDACYREACRKKDVTRKTRVSGPEASRRSASFQNPGM